MDTVVLKLYRLTWPGAWIYRCFPMFSELPMPLAGINTLVSSAVDSFFCSVESHLFATALYALYRYLAIPLLSTVVTVISPVDVSVAGQ